jgi:hypothetical protein
LALPPEIVPPEFFALQGTAVERDRFAGFALHRRISEEVIDRGLEE